MLQMVHITLFMAVSINGIIARPDYREDFLSRQNWDSFLECVERTGALIWGRKTHEKFRAYGAAYLEPLRSRGRIVVVSSDRSFAVEEGCELAASPREAIAALESKGNASATLSGGSILNASFAREHLIDEVEINIESVIIGRGIPLFAIADFDLRLDLRSVHQVNDRIIQLRASVQQQRPARAGAG